MSRSTRRCPNQLCGRPFQVNRFSADLDALADRGRVTCPHCGLVAIGDGNSIFLTHALSDEEEHLFHSQEKREGARY
jgi:hypothetical protein